MSAPVGAEAAGRAETVEPCPWCGRVPNVVPLYPEEPGNDAHMIECGDHRCICGIDRQTRAQCIEDWNAVVTNATRRQARERGVAERAVEACAALAVSGEHRQHEPPLHPRIYSPEQATCQGVANLLRASAARIVEATVEKPYEP